MPVSNEHIIEQMEAFVSRHGEDWESWFFGVTTDPCDCLVSGHNINIGHDLWMCSEALSAEKALEVKGYFVAGVGVDSDDSLDDAEGRFVYAYKKAPHTRP
jgi:hypothetical protein